MGYNLTLFQEAYIVSQFFGGAPTRRVALDFRNAFGLPISAPTVLRRVRKNVKNVANTIKYLMNKERTKAGSKRKLGFTPLLGNIWEIDEIYIPVGKKRCPLVVVKDLKTCFIVVAKLARSVTIKEVTKVLICARETANKCPVELRGDGHPSYSKAVKQAFGDKTKLTINKKIGQMGQDQSIESTFGNAIRSRMKRMKSLHSLARSHVIIQGLVIDYLFARPCEALNGKTPAEAAMAWKPVDGKRGWHALLRLAGCYAKKSDVIKMNSRKEKFQKQLTFDEFPGCLSTKSSCKASNHGRQLKLSLFLI
jgi:transposase-like protein